MTLQLSNINLSVPAWLDNRGSAVLKCMGKYHTVMMMQKKGELRHCMDKCHGGRCYNSNIHSEKQMLKVRYLA